MPQIRYQFNWLMVVISPTSRDLFVDVRMSSGGYSRVAWLGFLTEVEAEAIDNQGFAKMRAYEVSPENDRFSRKWRKIGDGEHVICKRVRHSKGGSHLTGVYALITEDGWPMVK